MQTPTIVKQTKDYMLVKIPLPKKGVFEPEPQKIKIGLAEKRLMKRLREAEKDVKEGRVITAASINEALDKYAKKQWD